MRAIIVEDEGLAREVLQNYLITYCPEVQIIGQAENIHQAVPLILKRSLILFSWILKCLLAMALMSWKLAKNYIFETIFITAYSEYAIKALNMSAAYYLLKTIEYRGTCSCCI